MSDVPKMSDAIDNFKAHRHAFYSSSGDHEELNVLLLNELGGPQVQHILRGCDMLLQALTEMDLTECYKMTPLLTGDQIKQVLKNIPKGTMFGEVSLFHFI